MTDEAKQQAVFSPQSQDLRPRNHYLTSLSFQSDDYCVFTGEMPPGAIVPLHSHADRESFYILAGEMSLYDGASWRTLKRGELVDVLSNTKHAWRNASEASASMLIVTTVRMGVFLQQVSSPVEANPNAGSADAQRAHFRKLVEEYGYWLASPEENEAIGLSIHWHNR